MRHLLPALLLPLCLVAPAFASAPAPSAEAGRQALAMLLEGNARYASDRALHPHAATPDRTALATAQKPLAVVVGCADSRVPPEIIFDQGLGDLFVVRVAGNAESDAVAASVMYGVEHLGAPLVMVLGHERCGAIQAVFAGGQADPALKPLLDPVAFSVAMVPYGAPDPVDAAVSLNVKTTVTRLRDRLVRHDARAASVLFAGARYDLDTGRADVIE